MARQQRSKRRKSLGERSAQKPLSDEQKAAIEARTCGEKKRFKFRGDAERFAAEHDLGIYKCQFCGNWHLTSKTP